MRAAEEGAGGDDDGFGVEGAAVFEGDGGDVARER